MAFHHQISSFPDENFYYTQNPYENGYNHYSSYSHYYPPPQSSANFYSYELAPTQPLIAYNHPAGSIRYTVYHSVAGGRPLPEEDEDLNFPEYDPQPYKGGYDIAETYGKPLPPGEGICYPPSSVSPNLPTPTPPPVPVVKEEINQQEKLQDGEEAENLGNKAQLTQEEEEEEDADEEEEEDRSMIVHEGVEVHNSGGAEINQLPHGSGLEAFDLCENLFGYWPCLSKMNRKCGSCGNEINRVVGGAGDDDVDEWKRTADYLFGNPDPYGGWTDQGGHPSAYPVHGYDQMQYQYQFHPHPGYAVYEQADQYAQNSWFP